MTNGVKTLMQVRLCGLSTPRRQTCTSKHSAIAAAGKYSTAVSAQNTVTAYEQKNVAHGGLTRPESVE